MGVATEAVRVFIGYDGREAVASHVAAHSIRKRTKLPHSIEYLKHRELRKAGAFARPWLIDGANGEFIDMIDGKPFSTEFSHTRFLVPHLMNFNGWALFMDSDMLFLSDVADLFKLCNDRYAVMCVKHLHQPNENASKMDGRLQLRYHRKNWSSFILWNCGHKANRSLTHEKINFMKGSDLHAFSWLKDNEIGTIPFTYNYISGVSPYLPADYHNMPDVIHYTEGGPWFETCRDVPYAQTWLDEYSDWHRKGDEVVVAATEVG